MPRFRYQALTVAGEAVEGELDAPDQVVAIGRLHDWSLIPISAEEGRSDTAKNRSEGERQRPLRASEVALFAQQLARLIDAGVPVDRALRLLITVSDSSEMERCLREVLDRLTAGASLAEALNARRGAFSETFVSMVHAGEIAGALHPVLVKTAEFLTRAAAMRQNVVSALVYPLILVVVSSAAVALVLTVVLPQFEPLFADAGTRLPSSTRLVIAVSHGLRHFGWLLLPAAIILILIWWRFRRVPSFALWRDRTILQLPLIGVLAMKIDVSRFCRMLGTLLGNGVSAPRALAMCASVMTNHCLSQAVIEVADRFKEGEGLATPLSRTGLFPDLSTQLIRIGEETGRLDELLQEVSTIYEHDAQRTLERLLTLLVPTLTICMGFIIGGIVVSILVAMLTVNSLAG